ncbi:insulin-like peptide [Centruroides sculpturatus]|uniref:insulin-like peptide n=1 Tax=Centruroides sculpturatus TaxID=218467 RepID=UPI000C6D29A5|nr:insulin-like peptide [Centruroides sculpturatus]XP_023214051.1 insulin-like peptide [Centruroides sculpturatus]
MPSHYPAFCLFLLLVLSQYSSNGEKEAKYRACGDHLTELLNLICGGRFHGPDTNQQSTTRSLYRSLSRRSFIGMRRGVVDECCHEACPVSTLRSYCLDPLSSSSSSLIELLSSAVENNGAETIKLAGTSSIEDTLSTQEVIDQVSTTHRPNLGLFPRNRPFFISMSSPLFINKKISYKSP